MKVYAQEIKDGLTGALADNKVKCECNIVECFDAVSKLDDKYKLALATFLNPNQVDLYYLHAILVSIGWNKNDDVFGRNDLISAVHSPVDKPFNFMHDNEYIIGHITDSTLVDQKGSVISSEQANEVPFDIAISAVLYKLAPVNEDKTMAELIKEIEDGSWKVSMECLFGNFDYAIITPDNQHKVIARDENSAFLTRHLRVYGGDGVYNGYKVGRFLRNINFAGVGLVSTPANPRSLILKNDPFSGVKANLQEIYMTVAQEDFDKVTSEKNDLATKLEAANKTIAEKDTLLTEANTALAELKAVSEKIEKEKKEKEDELEKANQKIKDMTRKAALAGLVDEVKANEILQKFASASDDMFNCFVSFLPKQEAKAAEAKETEEVTVAEITKAAVVDPGHETETAVTDLEKSIAAVKSFLNTNTKKKAKE